MSFFKQVIDIKIWSNHKYGLSQSKSDDCQSQCLMQGKRARLSKKSFKVLSVKINRRSGVAQDPKRSSEKQPTVFLPALSPSGSLIKEPHLQQMRRAVSVEFREVFGELLTPYMKPNVLSYRDCFPYTLKMSQSNHGNQGRFPGNANEQKTCEVKKGIRGNSHTEM